MLLNPKSEFRRDRRTPKGRVVTFYSYKGGTGRSMAVANVAWMLALSGERVLIIDWDLEAPGIHRYFHPFLDDKELTETEGLLDFVERLAGRAAVAESPLADHDVDIIEYIKILRWPVNSSLSWGTFGPFAGIDLLVAGRQGPAYAQKLNAFNWIDFYEKLGGRRLLGIARRQMQEVYDYILIDSRTGVSDTSGICTVEMPDLLVVCFTLNDQSIKGACGIVDSVLSQWRARHPSLLQRAGVAAGVSNSIGGARGSAAQDSASTSVRGAATVNTSGYPGLRVFPVPTRVEIVSERDKRLVALALAQQKFSAFIDHLPREARGSYWLKVQLPYFPFYAFEEIPAVFGDPASDELSLSTPLRHIARYISDNPSLEVGSLDQDYDEAERLRKEVLSWYLRKGDTAPQDAVQLAQATYDQCDRASRLLMKKVILRLVQVVPNSGPSLATVALEDFEAPLDAMVQTLARAGLVQVSGESVFLADRKVVESWDLLRQWLKEDGDFLLWRQKLAFSARSWRDRASDENMLLRGASLVEAMEWLGKRPDDLTDTERVFILACMLARDRSRRRVAIVAILIGIWTVVSVVRYMIERRDQGPAVSAAPLQLDVQAAPQVVGLGSSTAVKAALRNENNEVVNAPEETMLEVTTTSPSGEAQKQTMSLARGANSAAIRFAPKKAGLWKLEVRASSDRIKSSTSHFLVLSEQHPANAQQGKPGISLDLLWTGVGGVRADGISAAKVVVVLASPRRVNIRVWLSATQGQLSAPFVTIKSGDVWATSVDWTSTTPAVAAMVYISNTYPKIAGEDKAVAAVDFVEPITALAFVNPPFRMNIVEVGTIAVHFVDRNGAPVKTHEPLPFAFKTNSAGVHLRPEAGGAVPGALGFQTSVAATALGTFPIQASVPGFGTITASIQVTGFLLLALCALGGGLGGALDGLVNYSRGKYVQLAASLATGIVVSLPITWLYVWVLLPNVTASVLHNQLNAITVAIIAGMSGSSGVEMISRKTGLSLFERSKPEKSKGAVPA